MEQFADVVDAEGRRQVVRNGHLPEREVVTGVGPLPVKKPRVRDKRGERKFTVRTRRAPS